jgi:hypothetical protein
MPEASGARRSLSLKVRGALLTVLGLGGPICRGMHGLGAWSLLVPAVDARERG